MKTIKNVLLASSMVILSANVFAASSIDGNYGMHHNNKVIKTQAVDTKAEAYSLAYNELKVLEADTGSELNDDLAVSLSSYKEKNSVALDDGAYITIQEMMNEQGQIVYEGLVNVSYSYSQAN